ncbi:MAG: HNH endonuclease signature motif containing protein [Prosthecobacter sp.]|nr:HNH endonuclease signature motif containing protein [Prosthecobacter sp.]
MKFMLNKVASELAKKAEFIVPKNIINNDELITSRVEAAMPDARSSLRLVLSYLFKSNGPTNLRNRQYSAAKPYLTNYENSLACYLKSRTNGNGRRAYGKAGLMAMRRSAYRCEVCGEGDVRLLVLDHANGRDDVETFFVLCANCHQLKSRLFDWTGKKKAGVVTLDGCSPA